MRYSFRPTTGERFRVLTILNYRLVLCQVIFYGLLAVPVVVAAIVVLNAGSVTEAANPLLDWWPLVVCTWGGAFFGLPALRYWSVLQMGANNLALRAPFEYEFGLEGFHIKTGQGEEFVRWAAILEVVETDDFLLFFYTRHCAYYVPKRAVPEADVPILLALANERRASAMPPSSEDINDG